MKALAGLLLVLLLAAPLSGVAQSPDPLSFTGTVSHITLEGGFFAIQADNGQKYQPINLAPEFAVNGLRVQVTARVRKDLTSLRMVGPLLEITTISRLENAP